MDYVDPDRSTFNINMKYLFQPDPPIFNKKFFQYDSHQLVNWFSEEEKMAPFFKSAYLLEDGGKIFWCSLGLFFNK